MNKASHLKGTQKAQKMNKTRKNFQKKQKNLKQKTQSSIKEIDECEYVRKSAEEKNRESKKILQDNCHEETTKTSNISVQQENSAKKGKQEEKKLNNDSAKEQVQQHITNQIKNGFKTWDDKNQVIEEEKQKKQSKVSDKNSKDYYYTRDEQTVRESIEIQSVQKLDDHPLSFDIDASQVLKTEKVYQNQSQEITMKKQHKGEILELLQQQSNNHGFYQRIEDKISSLQNQQENFQQGIQQKLDLLLSITGSMATEIDLIKKKYQAQNCDSCLVMSQQQQRAKDLLQQLQGCFSAKKKSNKNKKRKNSKKTENVKLKKTESILSVDQNYYFEEQNKEICQKFVIPQHIEQFYWIDEDKFNEQVEELQQHVQIDKIQCQFKDIEQEHQLQTQQCDMCNIEYQQMCNLIKQYGVPFPLKIHAKNNNINVKSFKKCTDCDFRICNFCHYYIFVYEQIIFKLFKQN